MATCQEKKQFLGVGTSLERAHVVILPVAFDHATSYKSGASKGPAALIEASNYIELYDCETEFEIEKKGIYTAQPVEESQSKPMLDVLYREASSYIEQGKFLVTLGGDHSISSAPIRAATDHFGKLSILHLDAHADLYPAYEGNPYSHASVMARVLENLHVESIISVGLRSIAKEELPLLKRVHPFFAHSLKEGWIDDVISQLSDQVYISFDIDVFDPSLMPSTGTPEPGGLFWNECMELLKKVVETKKVVAFDLVELAPIPFMHAPDFLAAKVVYKLLNYLYSKGNS
jgi:agmatinase